MIVVVATAARVAYADHCADGVTALAKHDLPRAALYLDGCDDAEPKAVRELHKQLEASNLAVLQISSTPDGLDAEIDTLPGEHLVTPATVYVPAGEHEVRAGEQKKKVTTEARKHSAVIFESAAPKPVVVKDGHADFRDDGSENAEPPVGPPPVVAHRPMMPCKFTDTCSEHGEQIDDPLARERERLHDYPAWRIDLRGGTAYTNSLQPTVGLGATLRLPSQWLVWAQGSYVPRPMSQSIDATVALGRIVATTDTAWLIAGVGGDYDSWSGDGGAGVAEIALRELPIALGVEYVQRVHDWSDRTVFVELSAGFRLY